MGRRIRIGDKVLKPLKKILRTVALPCYDFATPYLNPEIPFPDNGTQVQSFSYHKEDLIIDALLGCKQKGTYIDIGANDPIFRNNTKRFSNRGWTGINIEPHPGKFAAIQKDRPGEINLNLAVSDVTATLPFYCLDWEMGSTLDKEMAERGCRLYKTHIKEIINIPVRRMDDIIATNIGCKHIDFVSIDAECHEMSILNGNDWKHYRPTLFCIELWYDNATDIQKFMESKGYLPVFKTEENGFFIDKRIL